MTKDVKYRYILADCDLSFKEQDIDDARYLWTEGHSLEAIYKVLRKRDWERTYDEVCLLIFDLSRKGLIESRPYGIFDNMQVMGVKK